MILFDWAQTRGTGDLLDDKEQDEKKAIERMNVWEGMCWDDKEKDEKKSKEWNECLDHSVHG